jgi:hypothetical protein
MNMKHTTLAAGRWSDFSFAEQLGNIGSEVSRAIRASTDAKLFEPAISRALELFDLTLNDLRWTGRLKEVIIARDLFCKAVKGNIDHATLSYLNRYFTQFACASRNPYVQARELLDSLFNFIDETLTAYSISLTAQTSWSPHIDDYETRERWVLREEGHSASEAQQLIDNRDQIIVQGGCRVQLRTTQIKDVVKNFENLQAKNAIKVIYDDWESYYRKRLEELLGHPVQGDIWGDLGCIRQSITHRRSLGVDKLKNAKIIKDFKPGDKIILTPAIMEKIQYELEQWYTDFLMKNFS